MQAQPTHVHTKRVRLGQLPAPYIQVTGLLLTIITLRPSISHSFHRLYSCPCLYTVIGQCSECTHGKKCTEYHAGMLHTAGPYLTSVDRVCILYGPVTLQADLSIGLKFCEVVLPARSFP